jgi:very-short-patch-repair endonuclease
MRHPNLARRLRVQQTTAERLLWGRLRRDALGVHFVRQYQVGPYFLDFARRELRIAIEVDGGQHATSQTDEERTRYLVGCGWRVVRSWNNQVTHELDAVVEEMARVVGAEGTRGRA